MILSILRAETYVASLIPRIIPRRVLPVLLGIFASTPMLQAQQINGEATVNKETVQELLRRIEQLEAADKELRERVAQLEKAKPLDARDATAPSSAATETEKTHHRTTQDSVTPAPGQVAVSPTTPPAAQRETTAPERIDPNSTLLNMRGFGDYSVAGRTQKGTTTPVSLGQIDLFITSDISDRFRFLTDLVFEKGTGNDFEEDLERVLLEYTHSDYFRLSVGRDHTAIGYYNLAFRHSSWWQTATGRPYLFLFEDEGGILPGHIVGASASGQIPSGPLGLHYIAEVGNGRAATPGAEPVQNFVDENNHKAVNINIFSRPDGVPGLQVGFSAYRDLLTPPNSARIQETILNTYAVFARSKFEWLNEGLLIRHVPQGLPHVFNTSGFYTQIAQAFGPFRPYLRYQYVNAPDNEPVFLPIYNVSVGLQHGPSVGLRYDLGESVAAKLQYDYTNLRRVQGINQQAFSQLALQFTFAF